MNMLPDGATYEEVYSQFRWDLPADFNIAEAGLDRHAAARPDAPYLIFEYADGRVDTISYIRMQRWANQWANTLKALGLARGDRVSILLPQNPAVPVTHFGCWKSGLVSSPMAVAFGEDAIEYRLNNSGAKAIVTSLKELPKIEAVRDRCPELQHVFVVDGAPAGTLDFWATLEKASDAFDRVRTSLDDPAYLNYTSGTTGQPKGALAAHRALLGHVPGIAFILDYMPKPGDVIWSPADWSWLAGLMNILGTGSYCGIPIAAQEPKGPFDPEAAIDFMARHKITVPFLIPTMLKYMRHVPKLDRFDLAVRVIGSGGEPVGAELIEWGKSALDVDINEGYGQTECNVMLGNNARLMPQRLGSLGKSLPGQTVAIVDDAGTPLPPGEEGQIAAKAPAPVMMLEYWKRPEATREKYANGWLLTGDLGHEDEEGYFWFHARADDVITSSGYRIGPGEIEEAILKHPAVQMAAAIGVPDPERTETIKAFIVPAPGHQPSEDLKAEIQDTLKTKLARHEYPREVEFVDSLPMTVTGKIMRRELKRLEAEKRDGGAS